MAKSLEYMKTVDAFMPFVERSGLVKSRYRWAGSGPESAKAGVRKAGDQVEAAARRHLGPVRGA
ncbi:MAG: hypothetical protein V3V08_14135, partial [Nannocystaceae bacterium]